MAKRKREGAPSARDVLSGAAHVDLHGLMTLIHEVNPTARALSLKDESRRYDLKSRLQSLLIREHGESLTFEPNRDPALVTIRHSVLAIDACHAKLSELDEDARSFVQRALDLERSGQPSEPKRPPKAEEPDLPPIDEDDDPLTQGRAALADYDFDVARAMFEQAFHASRGAREPALALLVLLVDHLADDAAARAVGARLSREVARDDEIRIRLGVAEGRLGDFAASARWVTGVDLPSAAAAWLACAEVALAANDLPRARELCARAARLDPQAGADVRRALESARRSAGKQRT